MRVLVSGISGFVGFHLSSLLLSRGFEVFGFDRAGSCQVKGVKCHQIDISDKAKLVELLAKVRPDYVFHLAALSSVKTCEDNPELAHQVNVVGTENLLSACIENDLKPKILITSSAYVYGKPEQLPLDESHPVSVVNVYGRSKLAQENIALEFFKKHNLPVIISRSFNHIGPGQGLGFVAADFAKQIAEIEKGIIPPKMRVGDLSAERDFSDVRDIVKAYLFLLEKGLPGHIYNVGSGQAVSIQTLLDKLLSFSSADIEIIKDPSLFRKSDVPVFVANNQKLINQTSWQPIFSLNQSLKDVLEFWRGKV